MNASETPRPPYWMVGLSIVPLLIYGDHAHSNHTRIHAQMLAWTILVFAPLVMKLRPILARRIPIVLASFLAIAHLIAIFYFEDHFPFHSGLTVILGGLAETFLLSILFLRLCQALDPDGPLGLTPAERKVRRPKLPGF